MKGIWIQVSFDKRSGSFATGICLVTVTDDTLGPLAMTVNSFSSVSLEPALVLWSIQDTSDHLADLYGVPSFWHQYLDVQEQAALSSSLRPAGWSRGA